MYFNKENKRKPIFKNCFSKVYIPAKNDTKVWGRRKRNCFLILTQVTILGVTPNYELEKNGAFHNFLPILSKAFKKKFQCYNTIFELYCTVSIMKHVYNI